MGLDEARLRELAQSDPEALEAALQQLRGRIFVPHDGQIPVMRSQARLRTLAAGRRFGKTKLGAREVVKNALKPNQMVWWVANSYKNVRRGYKEVVRQTPPGLLAKPAPVYTSNELILHYKSGTVVEFYSGGNPEALAGEGVDFLIVDEAALIEERVWTQLLRPTLMDTGGRALIISTPRAHNWFYEMYKRGEQRNAQYESWRFSQRDNPYIPEEETEAAREELPEIMFRQEIEAEFIAGGASIFAKGITKEGTIVEELLPPEGQVYMGIDLADKEDFTVLSAARAKDRRPCLHERFNQIGWTAQRERIIDAVRMLEEDPNVEGVTVLIDSTGVGDVVYENLLEDGIDVVPTKIKFDNTWKEKAVKLLAADMEKGRSFILEEQREEFEAYEFTLTSTGKYKFAAAMGHDDEVSAKLLENWGLNHEAPPDVQNLTAAQEEAEREAEVKLEDIEPDSPEDIMRRPEAWAGGGF